MSSMSRGALPDGARLQAVADALAPLRDAASEGAEDAMVLFVDLGDRATQAALDETVEQVADALRAIEAEAGEQVARLLLAARQLRGADEAVERSPGVELVGEPVDEQVGGLPGAGTRDPWGDA